MANEVPQYVNPGSFTDMASRELRRTVSGIPFVGEQVAGQNIDQLLASDNAMELQRRGQTFFDHLNGFFNSIIDFFRRWLFPDSHAAEHGILTQISAANYGSTVQQLGIEGLDEELRDLTRSSVRSFIGLGSVPEKRETALLNTLGLYDAIVSRVDLRLERRNATDPTPENRRTIAERIARAVTGMDEDLLRRALVFREAYQARSNTELSRDDAERAQLALDRAEADLSSVLTPSGTLPPGYLGMLLGTQAEVRTEGRRRGTYTREQATDASNPNAADPIRIDDALLQAIAAPLAAANVTTPAAPAASETPTAPAPVAAPAAPAAFFTP